MDVCGWCGFMPTGTPREHDGLSYCHGPGIPQPSCWQIATAGNIVVGNFAPDVEEQPAAGEDQQPRRGLPVPAQRRV